MTHPRKQLLFALLSLADLTLTCWLLGHSDGQVYEVNPVAGWWLARHGAAGLAGFKGAVVLLVLTLTAIIARRKPQAAGRILTFGCVSLVLVVLYSAALCPAACRSPEEREMIATGEFNERLEKMRCAIEVRRLRSSRDGEPMTIGKAFTRLTAGAPSSWNSQQGGRYSASQGKAATTRAATRSPENNDERGRMKARAKVPSGPNQQAEGCLWALITSLKL
jgi:hypothetical protein